MTGKVYLVGAGPGDPGLITVRGARLLRRADVVVLDALVSRRLVDGLRAQVIDAGKRGPSDSERAHGPSQSTINRLLIRWARRGKVVVRLKGGDPFVFGRGSEEMESLRAAGIPFEVVPGVTSAAAVPAYAGIPVTDRHRASQVTFVTGHEWAGKATGQVDWERISSDGTLVILMGVRSWPHVGRELARRGWPRSTPVAAIENGTTPQQRVLRSTLAASGHLFARARLSAPAILVVGRVAALASSLDWLRRERPLFGRRILVTASGHVKDRLAEALETEGAEPVVVPLVEVRPFESATLPLLKSAATQAELPYDGLVFLSGHAVRYFQQFWPDAPRVFARVPVAAVGPQTRAAALDAGWSRVRMPTSFQAAAIRRVFPRVRGRRFLVPRARVAPVDFVAAFEREGAQVDVLPVYETVFLRPTPAQRVAAMRAVDAITFLSASAAEAFASAFSSAERRRMFRHAPIVAIGEQTAASVRSVLGVRPVLSGVSTAEGVVAALRRVLKPK
jgi:uroporphyrinogen III methyltransferase/synthase